MPKALPMDNPAKPTLLSQSDLDKLTEIQNLLDEGLAHYLTYEGHCKSSEGYVSVSFGNSWDRRRGENPINVHVYSYVLGDGDRSYDFDSVDEALEAVKEWHAREMEYDPNTPEAIENREEMDRIAGEFIQTMMDSGRMTIVDLRNEDNESE